MSRTTLSLRWLAGASVPKAYAISGVVNLGLLAALASVRPGWETRDAVLLSRWGRSVIEVTIASAAGSPGAAAEEESLAAEPVVVEPTRAQVAQRTFHYTPAAELPPATPEFSLPAIDNVVARAELTAATPPEEPSVAIAAARLSRGQTIDRPGSGGFDSSPATPGSKTGSPDFSGNPPPAYPAQSVALREEGTAVVRLYIDETGRVTAVELAQSSGYPRLDTAAINATRKWRGKPAMRDGRPVAEVRRQPFEFYLH